MADSSFSTSQQACFFQKRAAKRHTLRPFGTSAASLRRLRESRSLTPAATSAIRLRILGRRSSCYQHDSAPDIAPLSRELDNFVARRRQHVAVPRQLVPPNGLPPLGTRHPQYSSHRSPRQRTP